MYINFFLTRQYFIYIYNYTFLWILNVTIIEKYKNANIKMIMIKLMINESRAHERFVL